MQRFGRYEVVEKLGSGGMGVVYKAVDPSIDRTVALKVLPASDNGSAELRERFQREARAAGRLQHPNIVVVYDIGEQDGSLYIAMEFLEGETLAERIASRTGLPDVSATIDIMAQVARGLHYAHERGVVHRDIKPANILVTREGIAKILDFGIARAAGDQRITKTLQVMGTVFYMSPEQINGQQLDGRSDIFSAGIVLYELLTGAVPFEADSTGATMMKILTATVPPLSDRVAVSPRVLDDLLYTALAKKPEERFVSAAVFAKALDAAKRLCEEQPRPAPVAAVSAYSAPEIAQEVAPESAPEPAPTVVHQSNPLRTPPPVSPPAPAPPTPVIGVTPGVPIGSVPRAETAPERTPSATTPASSLAPLHKRLWVRYVFLVVVIIAAISGIVALTRSPSGGDPLKIDVKPDTAETFYHRAGEYATSGEWDQAVTELNEAIRLKPDYAEAYYDRGVAYSANAKHERAIPDLTEAIRLKPDYAQAFSRRGDAYVWTKQYDLAIEDYAAAIRLKPDDAESYFNRGNAYAWKKNDDMALHDYGEAIRLKPDYAEPFYNRGLVYYERSQRDRAIQDFDQAIRLKPDHADALFYRGTTYYEKGKNDRAIQDFDEAVKLKPDYAEAFHGRGSAYWALGKYDRALQDVDEALRLAPGNATFAETRAAIERDRKKAQATP